VSKEGKDICRKLLEKKRLMRPSLEETLNHPWFSDFKDIHKMRVAGAQNADEKFKIYTQVEPNSPKIKEEIDRLMQKP
jgi:serine/threonine protein kinase